MRWLALVLLAAAHPAAQAQPPSRCRRPMGNERASQGEGARHRSADAREGRIQGRRFTCGTPSPPCRRSSTAHCPRPMIGSRGRWLTSRSTRVSSYMPASPHPCWPATPSRTSSVQIVLEFGSRSGFSTCEGTGRCGFPRIPAEAATEEVSDDEGARRPCLRTKPALHRCHRGSVELTCSGTWTDLRRLRLRCGLLGSRVSDLLDRRGARGEQTRRRGGEHRVRGQTRRSAVALLLVSDLCRRRVAARRCPHAARYFLLAASWMTMLPPLMAVVGVLSSPAPNSLS